MSESSQKRNHTVDPCGVPQPQVTYTCWFCRHPNPTGTALLGSHRGPGSKIKVCAPGEGCKDGRIFHGPQADPHYPDQDCPICGPAEIAKARRLAGDTPRATLSRRNARRPRPL